MALDYVPNMDSQENNGTEKAEIIETVQETPISNNGAAVEVTKNDEEPQATNENWES